jgi:hypothetical protein
MNNNLLIDTQTDEFKTGFQIGHSKGTDDEKQRIVQLLQILQSQAQDKNLSQTANISSIIALVKSEKE